MRSSTYTQRPQFFPCGFCGRKFTKRALEVHHQSCTEDEKCICFVCKNSKLKRLKRCEKEDKFSEDMFNKKLKEFIKTNQNSGIKEAAILLPTFDDNINANFPQVQQSEDISNVSTANLNSPMDTSEEVLKTNSSEAESLDSFHNGLPCSRKIFCGICEEHIFWHGFGVHTLTHCQNVDKNRIKCPHCLEIYSTPTTLLIHYYQHFDSHSENCSECHCPHPKCSEKALAPIAEHCYAENAREVARCYICLKSFSHVQSLGNHMRLHSKELPFTCSVCKRSFRQIGNLQRHMTTHRGDRPHKCPHCKGSFADPATLRNHLRVHTRETPYVCHVCHKGFTQVGNLKRHKAVHAQKEPEKEEPPPIPDAEPSPTTAPEATSNAVEPVPSSSTSTDSGTTTKGLHACSKCGKKYAWKHDLLIHFRIHSGEKPYKCEFCYKRFAQSGAVRIHKDRHHSGTASKGKCKIPS